jgi:hypothetical protein
MPKRIPRQPRPTEPTRGNRASQQLCPETSCGNLQKVAETCGRITISLHAEVGCIGFSLCSLRFLRVEDSSALEGCIHLFICGPDSCNSCPGFSLCPLGALRVRNHIVVLASFPCLAVAFSAGIKIRKSNFKNPSLTLAYQFLTVS